MDANTLRVELKIIKTEFLKQTGIRTFEDVNTRSLNDATKLLLRSFKEVVYYDYTIIKKNLSNREKQNANNYSNPRYWLYNLKPQHRDRHKKKLRDIILRHSQNLHSKISQDITNKCVTINQFTQQGERVIINSSYIELNTTQKHSKKKDALCKVTRLDISMQKIDSTMLSHTGLKFYYNTNKKEFNIVKNKYLSKKWTNASIDIQIREIAHNIRNKSNNQKITINREYNNNQTILFL